MHQKISLNFSKKELYDIAVSTGCYLPHHKSNSLTKDILIKIIQVEFETPYNIKERDFEIKMDIREIFLRIKTIFLSQEKELWILKNKLPPKNYLLNFLYFIDKGNYCFLKYNTKINEDFDETRENVNKNIARYIEQLYPNNRHLDNARIFFYTYLEESPFEIDENKPIDDFNNLELSALPIIKDLILNVLFF